MQNTIFELVILTGFKINSILIRTLATFFYLQYIVLIVLCINDSTKMMTNFGVSRIFSDLFLDSITYLVYTKY